MSNDKSESLHCSFCGKGQHEVTKLIAGPSVFICDECVDLCNDIIVQESTGETGDGVQEDRPIPSPKEIFEKMNEHIIGQTSAKKALSVAVHNHYKRLYRKPEDGVEIGKSNILMMGPTGTGKTLLAETLASIMDVPFAIADATTLTEAGYVGEDVENILKKLLMRCDNDVEKAERGIVYIDEIDKIARKSENPSLTRDVSGEGVQQALLKLIEGTVASIPAGSGQRKHPGESTIQISTKNILFICGGAFAGIEKIINDRNDAAGIGFSASVRSPDKEKSLTDALRAIQPEDLSRFGLIPEFVGRLPVITCLEEIDEDAMVSILSEPKNAVTKQYQSLFHMDGVELIFTEEALRAIAQIAKERGTGARGLRSILESVLQDIMFELSGTDVERVTITEGTVKNGEEPQLEYRKAA